MRATITVSFLAFALSGCLGGGTETPTGGSLAIADGPGPGLPAAPNATLPLLGVLDPWGNETELVLFDGTVTITPEDCGGPVGVGGLVFGQGANWGCWEEPLPEGTLLPWGGSGLRIEADASAATRQGEWGAYIATTRAGYVWQYGNRSVEGEPTTERNGTWTFPLFEYDLDNPWAAESAFSFGVWAYGSTLNVLQGDVEMRVTALRDPLWRPVNLTDEWENATGHRFVGPGVMNLLDTNLTFREPGWADLSAGWPGGITFADLVPFGTKQLTVASREGSVQGCPPPYSCRVYGYLDSWGTWAYGNEVREGDWRITVYDVPDEVVPDVPNATAGGTYWWGYFEPCTVDGCSGVASLPGYYLFAAQPRQAELRLVVDAWLDRVDLAALEERLASS